MLISTNFKYFETPHLIEYQLISTSDLSLVMKIKFSKTPTLHQYTVVSVFKFSNKTCMKPGKWLYCLYRSCWEVWRYIICQGSSIYIWHPQKFRLFYFLNLKKANGNLLRFIIRKRVDVHIGQVSALAHGSYPCQRRMSHMKSP